MSESQQRVTCPGCDKGYRWQASLIGRLVPCKQCGAEFRVPDAPGIGIANQPEPVAEGGTYDLDFDAIDDTPASPAHHAVPAANGKCPSCNSPVREGATLCMNCGFNMVEGKKVQTNIAAGTTSTESDSNKMSKRIQRDMETAEETYRQHAWQEYTLPIILLCVGLVFALINALGLTPAVNTMYMNKGYGWASNGQAIVGYFVVFALTLIMMLPLLFGGILFMAAVFGSAFGNLFTAILKLLALTIFVVSLDHMVDLLLDLGTGGFGGIGYGIRLTVVLAAFYPICIKLFDMDSHEIWTMFLLYVIGPMAVGMFAMIIALSFL